MSVVAGAALAQDRFRMGCVDLGEIVALMAVKAPAFEAKPAALVYFMTLGTLNVRNRRMLMERRKARRRIRA